MKMIQITREIIQSQVKSKPDVDEENDVSMYCTNSDEATDQSNIRGYVFHGNDLVLQGFPYPTDVDDKTMNNIIDISKVRVFDSHEGTIIRVFNVNGKWYVSTNRRLNAMYSKWAAKHETFGHSFTNAIRELLDHVVEEEEEDESEGTYEEKLDARGKRDYEYLVDLFESNNLDPKKKYMFIVKPSQEERIVCKPELRPTIYHVGTFTENNTLTFDDTVTLNGITIEKTKEHSFKTLDDLKLALMSLNIEHHQGFLAVDIETNQHFKILHPQYKFLFDVRGNTASLRFRYLQLRRYNTAKDHVIYNEFIKLYNFDWQGFEDEIYKVCEDLNRKYTTVCIDRKQKFNDLGDNDKKMLNLIHRAYMTTRIKTTPSVINNILTGERPHVLNRAIKSFEKGAKRTE
jgi:hypothetical protein